MIAYEDIIKIFCGTASRSFAETVCKELQLPMGASVVSSSADVDVSVTL